MKLIEKVYMTAYALGHGFKVSVLYLVFVAILMSYIGPPSSYMKVSVLFFGFCLAAGQYAFSWNEYKAKHDEAEVYR